MPKKRWYSTRYPPNWRQISYRFREEHNFVCEHCGTRQGTPRVSHRGRTYFSIVCAAHRWPGDTMNPNPDLLCLCEICHFYYDWHFRRRKPALSELEHQKRLHTILIEQKIYLEDFIFSELFELEREEREGEWGRQSILLNGQW